MIPMNVYPASSVVPIFFSTYGKTNGESITLTGLAVTDIEIYKGTSTTQRSSDAGYALIDTDGIDVDGVTGIHGFSIDLGDNTDSGFYAVGSFYTVVVSAVTVDGQTVNFIADRFRIVPAEGITGYPKVDVHAFAGSAATAASGIPEVKVASLANNAITASAIASDAITAAKVAADVSAEIADAVWDEATSGHTTAGSTGKAVIDILEDTGTTLDGRLPAALVGGRMDANVGAISTDATAADNLEAMLDGTGGVTLTTALTGPITGNITGSLSGSVGSVTGDVGGAVNSVTGNVGGNVTGSVGSLAAQAKADVNAEVLDVLNVDTFAEPGQGAPAATASIATKLGYLYKFGRNKITQTSTTMSVFADDGTTVDQKSTVSDDGTTYTRGEIASGP